MLFYRKSPTGQDFAENVKHKVWLRVGLDDIEIVKSKLTSSSIGIEQNNYKRKENW